MGGSLFKRVVAEAKALGVLRDLLPPAYGWNTEFVDIYKRTDIVTNVIGLTHSGKQVVSVLCLVFIACVAANTAYVIVEFRSMKFERIWATKLLRSFGTFCVTALYPTIFEYGSMAATCEFWVATTSLPSTGCGVWSSSKALLTIVAIILMVFHFVFGLAVSLYLLEINPMSTDPLAAFVGRSEALYVVMKTVFIIVPLFSGGGGGGILVVLLVAALAFTTLGFHVYEQPFHAKVTNIIRGAMYGAACGLCTGAVVATSAGRQSAFVNPLAVALTLLMSIVGGVACDVRVRLALRQADKIRAHVRLDNSVIAHGVNGMAGDVMKSMLSRMGTLDEAEPVEEHGFGLHHEVPQREMAKRLADAELTPSTPKLDVTMSPPPRAPPRMASITSVASMGLSMGPTSPRLDMNRKFSADALDWPGGSGSPVKSTVSNAFGRKGFMLRSFSLESQSDKRKEHSIPGSVASSPGVRGQSQITAEAFFTRGTGNNERETGASVVTWGDVDAVVACRAITAERSPESVEKIEKVLTMTVEHKAGVVYTSLWLAAFTLFVNSDYELCGKILDALDDVPLRLDAVFLRFAIRQKMVQLMQSSNLGNELTAIGIMEVTKEQEAAQKHHREAVRSMQAFWRSMVKGDVGSIQIRLSHFFESYERANRSFDELMSKFPSSPELLRAKAAFVMDVANDIDMAEHLRDRAAQLEDMNKVDPDEEDGGDTSGHSSGRKSASKRSTGSSASSATRARAAVDEWGLVFLQRELDLMAGAAISVRFAMMAMLVFLSLGVVVTDQWLFSGHAADSISQMHLINECRTSMVDSVRGVRSYITAVATDTDVDAASAQLTKTADDLARHVVDVYEGTGSAMQKELSDLVSIKQPSTWGRWSFQDHTLFAALRSLSEHMRGLLDVDKNFVKNPRAWDEQENRLMSDVRVAAFNSVTPLLARMDFLAVQLEFSIRAFSDMVIFVVAVLCFALTMIAVFVITLVSGTVRQPVVYLRTATIITAITAMIPKRTLRGLVSHYHKIDKETFGEADAGAQEDLDPSSPGPVSPGPLRMGASVASRSPGSVRISRTPTRSPASIHIPNGGRSPASARLKMLNDPMISPYVGEMETVLELEAEAGYVHAIWPAHEQEIEIDDRDSDGQASPHLSDIDDEELPQQEDRVASIRSFLDGAVMPLHFPVLPRDTSLPGSVPHSEWADAEAAGAEQPRRPKIRIGANGNGIGNSNGNGNGTPLAHDTTSASKNRRADGKLGNGTTPNSSGGSDTSTIQGRAAGANVATTPQPSAPTPMSKKRAAKVKVAVPDSGAPMATIVPPAGTSKPSLVRFASHTETTSLPAISTPGTPTFSTWSTLRKVPLRKRIAHVLPRQMLGVAFLLIILILSIVLTESGSGVGHVANSYLTISSFLSDMAPPPCFVIEAYLLALELELVPTINKRQVLDRFHLAKETYFKTMEQWSGYFTDDATRKHLDKLDYGASRLFRAVEEELTPAVGAHNNTAIRLAYSHVRAEYLMHKEAALAAHSAAEEMVAHDLKVFQRHVDESSAVMIGVTFICAVCYTLAMTFMYDDQFRVFVKSKLGSWQRWGEHIGGGHANTAVDDAEAADLHKESEEGSSASGSKATTSLSTSAMMAIESKRSNFDAVTFAFFMFCVGMAMVFESEVQFADSPEFRHLVKLNAWIADVSMPHAMYIEGFVDMTEKIVFDETLDLAHQAKLLASFDERYTFWSEYASEHTLLQEIFMVAVHDAGRTVATMAMDNLPAAQKSGHYAAVKLWHELHEHWRTHTKGIALCEDQTISEQQHALMELEQSISLTRLLLPVLAASCIVGYKCLLHILFGSRDVMAERMIFLEKGNTRIAKRLPTIRRQLAQHSPIYMLNAAQILIFMALPLLTIITVTIPLRHLSNIVNISPLINQVNRRHALTTVAIQYLVEAGHGDRFVGSDAQTIADMALLMANEALDIDKAVREGGGLSIRMGTNHRYPDIDDIMYQRITPLPLPEDHAMVNFVSAGLQHALSACNHWVVEVGGGITEPDLVYPNKTAKAYHGQLRYVATVPTLADRMWSIHSDTDREMLKTMSSTIQDYLDQESSKIEVALEREFKYQFDQVHYEMRLLFALDFFYIGAVFYWFFFRQTVQTLRAEILRARKFVMCLPMQILPETTILKIRSAFADEDD